MLILAGVLMLFGQQIPFLGGGIVNGMWTIFIGWFLHSAAEQNYHRIIVKDILEDVPVKRIMNPEVPFVPANIRIDDLIEEHLMQTDHQAFLVIDKGKLVGLISIDDVRKVEHEARRTTLARDIMTPSKKLVVVAPEENASEALDRLEDQKIRQLPVVQGNKIVGLVRRKDILRWLTFQSQSR
jgi:CBS domain-containing protein